jgi:hypothetical protein
MLFSYKRQQPNEISYLKEDNVPHFNAWELPVSENSPTFDDI